MSRLDVPFKNVIKANERISTLRNHIVNAKLIQNTEDLTSVANGNVAEGIRVADKSLGKMAELILNMKERFPWAARHIDEGMISGLGNSALGKAMLDITLDRLSPHDLHSCGTTRDWFLADGLATFLRSGITYQRYNPNLRESQPSMKDTTVKRKEIPLIRWCPRDISKATNRTLLRVNEDVRGN